MNQLTPQKGLYAGRVTRTLHRQAEANRIALRRMLTTFALAGLTVLAVFLILGLTLSR